MIISATHRALPLPTYTAGPSVASRLDLSAVDGRCGPAVGGNSEVTPRGCSRAHLSGIDRRARGHPTPLTSSPRGLRCAGHHPGGGWGPPGHPPKGRGKRPEAHQPPAGWGPPDHPPQAETTAGGPPRRGPYSPSLPTASVLIDRRLLSTLPGRPALTYRNTHTQPVKSKPPKERGGGAS